MVYYKKLNIRAGKEYPTNPHDREPRLGCERDTGRPSAKVRFRVIRTD